MPSRTTKNKKTATTESQKKTETQNLSVSKKLSASVVARKASAKKKTTVRGSRASLSAPMYDAKGAKHGTFALPKEIFGAKVNEPLMAQAVRVYLANQRQGNATTKTRGEVTLTSAKWYRQKGTGRARHGAKSAPIFVGGGVAHGPKIRDYSLKLPQKMRKAALLSALSLKASAGEIKVLSGLLKAPPKTKPMAQMIAKVTADKKGKSRVLLITSKDSKDLGNVYRAAGNIRNVEIINARLLNTYEVLKHKNILFMKESFEAIAGGSAKQSSKS